MKLINSEFAEQMAHLRGLTSQPIKYLQNAENLSIRSCYIFYALVHLAFIGIDFWQQNYIIANLLSFLNESSIAVTFTPLIEHYLANKIFFVSFLLSVNLILFPLVLAKTAFVYSLSKTIGFKKIYIQNLLVAAFIPLMFSNYYLLSTIGILSAVYSTAVFIANGKEIKTMWIFICQNLLHLVLILSPLILNLFLS